MQESITQVVGSVRPLNAPLRELDVFQRLDFPYCPLPAAEPDQRLFQGGFAFEGGAVGDGEIIDLHRPRHLTVRHHSVRQHGQRTHAPGR
jgi:hypothetical protein